MTVSALLLVQVLNLPIIALPARAWPVKMETPDLTCRVRDADGKPIRSQARKRLFLRTLGFKDQPTGYYIDHIVPLACGGCDIPSNMSLLSETEWRAKTKYERSICGQQKTP